ncbi:MAG: GDCCVxC domain-containing (seleno)protein [Roseiarcus sp.]
MLELKMVSTITCPVCGHEASETMSTDSCQYFYQCTGCKTVLKPKAGDCCVFCSYGDTPCPPIREARASGLRPYCCT